MMTLVAAKRGEHHADDKRRAAELRDIERQDRREHGILRIA